MKRIDIQGTTGRSAILVGERLANVKKYLPVDRPVIITDSHVRQLYGSDFPPGAVICIGTGEAVKTLDTVAAIYDQLVGMEADRSSFVLGIGGGLVCDIAGFAASTYMRGMRFGFVSTTLLSQVDASVGGKNGVNFGGYKNMVGVFNQPETVICDLDLLRTLPETEIQCGFAEIIKHAAIADARMFAFLEAHREAALTLDRAVIEKLVCDSVVIKSGVVNRDERETGERRKLNFGHTVGHAIEKATRVPHGQAVSMGMVVAAALSVRRGLLPPGESRRLVDLLAAYRLPTRLEWDTAAVIDALGKDKKRAGSHIHFVLLDGIGKAVVKPIAIDELKQTIEEIMTP